MSHWEAEERAQILRQLAIAPEFRATSQERPSSQERREFTTALKEMLKKYVQQPTKRFVEHLTVYGNPPPRKQILAAQGAIVVYVAKLIREIGKIYQELAPNKQTCQDLLSQVVDLLELHFDGKVILLRPAEDLLKDLFVLPPVVVPGRKGTTQVPSVSDVLEKAFYTIFAANAQHPDVQEYNKSMWHKVTAFARYTDTLEVPNAHAASRKLGGMMNRLLQGLPEEAHFLFVSGARVICQNGPKSQNDATAWYITPDPTDPTPTADPDPTPRHDDEHVLAYDVHVRKPGEPGPLFSSANSGGFMDEPMKPDAIAAEEDALRHPPTPSYDDEHVLAYDVHVRKPTVYGATAGAAEEDASRREIYDSGTPAVEKVCMDSAIVKDLLLSPNLSHQTFLVIVTAEKEKTSFLKDLQQELTKMTSNEYLTQKFGTRTTFSRDNKWDSSEIKNETRTKAEKNLKEKLQTLKNYFETGEFGRKEPLKMGKLWQPYGIEPPENGRELTNPKLAFALRNRTEFTEQDLQDYELTVQPGDYIKVMTKSGPYYYQVAPLTAPADQVL